MFDFDAGKLIIIGVVALIVIGPKELPGVLRQIGRMVAKMRRMAAEFQGQFMDAMREADLEEVKADVAKLAESAKVDVAFNPMSDIKSQISGAIEGEAKAPSAGIGAEAPTLPSPYDDGPPLNSVDLPHLPLAAAEGEVSPGDAGAAPLSPDPQPVAPAAGPGGIEAEMKALASALEAEMAAAPAAGAEPQAQPQEKA
ncbi:Sec-independent protein translocase protein TatB [Methylocapsa palsarum]|uniref:Sec-independent protein translocase protein TatB n=1 Tax=Methylocapsa palsarum TaxID=1612308 RepID=A0A1I3YCW2_9HYPH|nr:Sec-independent protein translocase protein TatB [Methylocapsa palsarum]SFK29708.1 sec-independent protein translocase protein TatB [Methylocapsa palsarum]